MEDDESVSDELLAALPVVSGTFRVGITGAPGVGKSTLISKLIPYLLKRGERVAVLAVDPTSPISGGAVLGDRVRLTTDHGDELWFRSIASRGATSGIAGCTDLIAEILARAGFGIVIIETVGVGQLEVEITEETDQAWLLLSPESGDAIQLLKGGLLEVAQRVVVHKCDRPGSDDLMRWARDSARDQGLADPIAVSSEHGDGIEEVADAIIDAASSHRSSPDDQRTRARMVRRIRRRAEKEWLKRAVERAGGSEIFEQLADRVCRNEMSVRQALASILPDPHDGGRDR